MWLSITLRSVFASPIELTQPGNWLCHTSVWPRMRCPCASAWPTIWSAGPKLNEPRDGSVVSHFISFSGVIMLNSRSRIVEYVELLSLPAATAVPKQRPGVAACAPSVAAACAGRGMSTAAPATVAAADNTETSAHTRWGRIKGFMVEVLSSATDHPSAVRYLEQKARYRNWFSVGIIRAVAVESRN